MMAHDLIKCDWVFDGSGLPSEDVEIVASGNECYVQILIGDKQILLREDQARKLIFSLHKAVMEHIEAAK